VAEEEGEEFDRHPVGGDVALRLGGRGDEGGGISQTSKNLSAAGMWTWSPFRKAMAAPMQWMDREIDEVAFEGSDREAPGAAAEWVTETAGTEAVRRSSSAVFFGRKGDVRCRDRGH